MPRQSQTQLKGAQQTDRRQFFDETKRRLRSGVSRPTDPFVRPSRRNDWANFAQGMQNLSGGFATALNRAAQEEAEAGYTAAAKGEEAPVSPTQAFMEGYERFTVAGDVLRYQQDVDAAYAGSGDMLPEEFFTELEKINVQYMAGRSDNSTRLFAGEALKIQERARAKHLDDQRVHIKNTLASGIIERAELSLLDVLDPDQQIADQGAAMRQVLSDMQAELKAINAPLSTHEATAAFAQATTELAIRHGRPDFLDWAFTADASGYVASKDPRLHNTISSALDASLSKRQANERAAVQAGKQAEEARITESEQIIAMALETGQYGQAESELIANWQGMSPEHISKWVKRLNELRLDENWAKVVDAERYPYFQSRAAQGLLSSEDLEQMNSYMPRQAYIKLVDMNGRVKPASGTPSKQYVDRSFRDLSSHWAGARDAVGNLLDVNGNERLRIVTDTWFNQLTNHLREVGDYDTITPKHIQEWRKACDESVNHLPKISIQNMIAGNTGGQAAEKKPYGIQKATGNQSTETQEAPEKKGLRDRVRSLR